MFHGKINYFDWAVFNSYVKLPEGNEWQTFVPVCYKALVQRLGGITQGHCLAEAHCPSISAVCMELRHIEKIGLSENWVPQNIEISWGCGSPSLSQTENGTKKKQWFSIISLRGIPVQEKPTPYCWLYPIPIFP